jgi:hypothetical protein
MRHRKRKRPVLASKPGVKLALIYYAALSVLANFLGTIFWRVEQRRSRVADDMERRRT